VLPALLATVAALLAGILVLLAGVLGLLAGLLATTLLSGLLLAALLLAALVRVLRILVHRVLPWAQPGRSTKSGTERSAVPHERGHNTSSSDGQFLGKSEE
jgi:hypothetical protein